MQTRRQLMTFCSCGGMLLRHEAINAHVCASCLKVFRNGIEVLLARVSPVLHSLAMNSGLDAPTATREPLPDDARCAWCRKPLSGPSQGHHLFRRETHGHHPMVDHRDNIAPLCRSDHRTVHMRAHGFDFAAAAARAELPPTGYGPLALGIAIEVTTRAEPARLAAILRTLSMLEPRLRQHRLRSLQPIAVALYHLWLYTTAGGARGLRALRGLIFDYDDYDYVLPGPHGEPGQCRTYVVPYAIAEALRRLPFIQIADGDKDFIHLAAALLERRGLNRREIARALPIGQGGRRPAPSTLSRWITAGRRLLEAAEPPEPACCAGGASHAQTERVQPYGRGEPTPAGNRPCRFRRLRGARRAPALELWRMLRARGPPSSTASAAPLGEEFPGDGPIPQRRPRQSPAHAAPVYAHHGVADAFKHE